MACGATRTTPLDAYMDAMLGGLVKTFKMD